MPSLRELFLAIPKHQVHKESYALLEALVEMVTLLVAAVSTLEPENIELAEAKAEIERLQHGVRDMRKELAEAKAELDTAYQGFKATVLKLREEHDGELAKAKAEIEGLQRSRGYWHERCRESEHQETASARRNNADAKKWQLVLGMRRGAGLMHTGSFSTSAHDWTSWTRDGKGTDNDDPALALREIQEVSDD